MTCFHTTIDGLKQVIQEAKPKKLVVVHQVGAPIKGALGIPHCTSSQQTNCVIFANDLQMVTP